MSVAEYAGVLVILALAALLVGGILAVQRRLAPRRRFAEKLEPFECGQSPADSSRRRFGVEFYVVAILFVVFDVAAIYFYAWSAVFGELGRPALVAIGLFGLPLVVGLVYQWRKGALEW